MKHAWFAAAVVASALVFAAAGGCGDSSEQSGSAEAGPADARGVSDVHGDSAIDVASVSEASTSLDASDASDSSVSADVSDAQAAGDAITDAPVGPTHVMFVTAAAYPGNLIAAANALAGDGGIAAPDGGAFLATDWQKAGDAICQTSAQKAGRTGTFLALLEGPNVGDAFARITDADGPWALVDGTPVAATVADLNAGLIRSSIDRTETGAVRTYKVNTNTPDPAWFGSHDNGFPAYDCNGWTATKQDAGVLQGVVGGYRVTTQLAWGWGGADCAVAKPLYCIEVGAGGGPLQPRTLSSGSKVAFITTPVPAGDFVTKYLADGGTVPDGGVDSVHAAADAICKAQASGKLPGTFHAWISSASADAPTYFAAHQMAGPWYRPDGTKVAGSLADLTNAPGTSSQIMLDPSGNFVTTPAAVATYDDGTFAPDNCNGFTSASDTLYARGAYPAFKDKLWCSQGSLGCQLPMALFCFQE
jgi:hypothetical protein